MSYDNMAFFNTHKAKFTKDYRTAIYWLYLWQVALNAFEYKGLPDSLPSEYIEGILLTNGICGVGEHNGKLYATTGGYYGNINGYIPTKYRGAIQGIGTIDGDAISPAIYDIPDTESPVIVGWNNAMQAPDIDIYDTALALAEGRTSEDINIIFSRLLRIPIAKDSKEKAIIDSAIKAIINGNIEAVTSATKSLETEINGVSERQFLDLVDVKDTDKLQYLNQYMDNVLKRYMQRHGHAMQITSKLAQQTNAEMHGADDISMIYPLEQLKYRKRFIDDLNKYYGTKYGFTASVEFGKLLKNNYDRVINYVPDELNEKGVVDDNSTDVENNVETVETEEKDGENNENVDK